MIVNFIKVIYNTIFGFIWQKIYNYFNKNNKILEFPKNYQFDKPEYDLIDQISESNNLVKTMIQFLDKHYTDQKYLIVSLSGGVDSMVLISILHRLKDKYGYQIATATIDYSLREESKDESEFTKLFCQKYGIVNHLKTIKGVSRKDNTCTNSRTEFEEESRSVRYNLYKELLEKYNSNMIFVAHHRDDITENVFTNFMRGKNMLDLSVMHEINNINGVNIARPFLNHPKQDIYDLAHSYMIPYFLDTTPDWSNRGKMRRRIFPQLIDMFGNSFRSNLNNMGDYSYQVGQILDSYVFQPFLKDLKKFKYGVSFKIQDKRNAPFVFWENILMNVFHNMGSSMPSRKSIKMLMEALQNNKKEFYYPIKKDFIVYINQDTIYVFRDFLTNIEANYNTQTFEDLQDKENNQVNMEDFMKGKITYLIPEHGSLNKNNFELVNSKHIIRQLTDFNLPNQIFKIMKLPILECEERKTFNLKKVEMTF